MIVINGTQYAVDNTQLTEVKNQLVNTLQNKTILWQGESKLLTTVLQTIFDTASGKANIVVADSLPSTLTKNSQYWVKSNGSTVLTNGRYIYVVDNLGVSTYVGTTDVDLSSYVKQTDILTSSSSSATDTQLYSAKYIEENVLKLSGGTMTGAITIPYGDAKGITGSGANGTMYICGGSSNAGGASVQLQSASASGNAWLKASNGTNSNILALSPTASTGTINGKNIFLADGSISMTGDIISNASGATLKRGTNDNRILIQGGTNTGQGAYAILRGGASSYNPGCVELVACKTDSGTTTSIQLTIKPDGSMYLGSNYVLIDEGAVTLSTYLPLASGYSYLTSSAFKSKNILYYSAVIKATASSARWSGPFVLNNISQDSCASVTGMVATSDWSWTSFTTGMAWMPKSSSTTGAGYIYFNEACNYCTVQGVLHLS